MAKVVLILWLAALAAAPGVDPVAALRHDAVTDPAGTIRRGRALLDGGALAPDVEREVLRWMGKAALLANSDAALTEAALRLDSLAESHHDAVAGAYAGFLRAEHLAEQGQGEASLKEALHAAERLQDRREPALRALVAYHLCDATSAAEQFERAHAYCTEAEELYGALGDQYDLARTENIHSYVFYNQERRAEAVRLAERSRERFLAIGEAEVAGIVGDNLGTVDADDCGAIAAPSTECVSSTAPFYADWVAFGKPACWCYAANCKGDADGLKEGNALAGYRKVYTGDLNILLSAYDIKEPPKGPGIATIPNGICADFDRTKEGNALAGYRRVYTGDLNILLANYDVKEPPKGPGIGDCAEPDYNFFVEP